MVNVYPRSIPTVYDCTDVWDFGSSSPLAVADYRHEHGCVPGYTTAYTPSFSDRNLHLHLKEMAEAHLSTHGHIIVTKELVEVLTANFTTGKVLDACAGNGWLSKCLRQSESFDKNRLFSLEHSPEQYTVDPHCPVGVCNPIDYVNPEIRNLIIVWPEHRGQLRNHNAYPKMLAQQLIMNAAWGTRIFLYCDIRKDHSSLTPGFWHHSRDFLVNKKATRELRAATPHWDMYHDWTALHKTRGEQ